MIIDLKLVTMKLSNYLESKKIIDDDNWNRKIGTLALTFHKPAGEENMYVRFGYGSLKIF